MVFGLFSLCLLFGQRFSGWFGTCVVFGQRGGGRSPKCCQSGGPAPGLQAYPAGLEQLCLSFALLLRGGWWGVSLGEGGRGLVGAQRGGGRGVRRVGGTKLHEVDVHMSRKEVRVL